MTGCLEDEVRRIVGRMEHEAQYNQEQELPGTPEQERAPEPNPSTPPDEIEDIYVLIVREREAAEEQPQVVESTLVLPPQPSMLPAYAICCGYLLLVVCTLAFQLSCLFNPPGATVTIIPQSQTVTLTGTLQLGRLLSPITISQSQTAPATGKGHQDARSATGSLTFYNGQLQSVTVPAGTYLTGTSGIQVVTDADATIPPLDANANPPTVPAHAVNPGSRGNVPRDDINQACCFASVIVKNLQRFSGGQDEREFATVSPQDITRGATLLKTAVAQSVNGAFQGQRKADERLQLLPCPPTVTSDHRIGQEATTVNVTVSETCRAVAYNEAAVAAQATDLLAHQAAKQAGTGYSLFGNTHVSVRTAAVSTTAKPQVFLAFSASGTWVYGLSRQAQERIEHLLAGKTTQAAVQLLATLPGVEQATIRLTGFGDEMRLPKQSSAIHLVFVVM